MYIKKIIPGSLNEMQGRVFLEFLSYRKLVPNYVGAMKFCAVNMMVETEGFTYAGGMGSYLFWQLLSKYGLEA